MNLGDPTPAVPALSSIAFPLDEFYVRAGLRLPPLQQIDGEEMPEPHHSLLVHQNDMTSTLENFHRQTVVLRVLGRDRRGSEYYREVVLFLEGSGLAVEFGATRIYLDRFSSKAQEQILQEHWPLGHILAACKIEYLSRPQAFFRVASDALINRVLDLSGAHVLYGRRNVLLNLQGLPLAEVVEILPPPKP